MEGKIVRGHEKRLYNIALIGSRCLCEVSQGDESKRRWWRIKKGMSDFIQNSIKRLTMKSHFRAGQMRARFSDKSRRIPVSVSIDPGIKNAQQLARLR